MEKPDRWIVIQIGKENPLYKVLVAWYGGYLGEDRWKINSGILNVVDNDQYINFYGYSGSVYQCPKNGYGTSNLSQGILNRIMKGEVPVKVLPEDTDWLTLLQL
jgi:hypothetical protein